MATITDTAMPLDELLPACRAERIDVAIDHNLIAAGYQLPDGRIIVAVQTGHPCDLVDRTVRGILRRLLIETEAGA